MTLKWNVVCAVLMLLGASALNDLSAAPIPPATCIEVDLGCDEKFDIDYESLECIYTCYVTHYCAHGPAFSYRETVRVDCSDIIPGPI